MQASVKFWFLPKMKYYRGRESYPCLNWTAKERTQNSFALQPNRNEKIMFRPIMFLGFVLAFAIANVSASDALAKVVKADGRTVGVNNKKLKTWDYFPLRKTPLRLLLADRIDVNDKAIKSVKLEQDLTTVVLANKSIFGNSKITLMFDPKSYDLRQWTITDNQGKDTSVMIFNIEKNVKFSKRLFRIDQAANSRISNER